MLMATIQNEAKEFSAARSSYEKLLAVNPDFFIPPSIIWPTSNSGEIRRAR